VVGELPVLVYATPARQRAPVTRTGNTGYPGAVSLISDPVAALLARHRPRDSAEAADLDRSRELARTAADPWLRSRRLHFTASALVVHPASARVLLRWHQRQQAWLQVGGHGDPGETDPVAIALREGREETGLGDLVPWPDASLLQVAIVDVPAREDEPDHQHADLRFMLATADPDAARPESPDAPLRWLTIPQAREATTEGNVRDLLGRAESLFTRWRTADRQTPGAPAPGGQ
jgi:8-oxo-dGTP pyrophosphatase MutT (NUDIX family)